MERRVPFARFTAVLPMLALAAAVPAHAQDQVTTPPPSLVLNNYGSVPVGPFGGLEGASIVTRVGDPSAAWFNPAGLTREDTAQISGSAGVYERTTVNPLALPDSGGSIQQLPNYAGFTFKPNDRLTLGAALLTTNSWTQQTDSQLVTPTASGAERFAYSGDSEFTQRELAFAAGYERSGRFRAGGGLAFAVMNLRLVQSASDRIADNTGLKSLLVTARVSGSAILLRGQAGLQYDLSPQWRVGGAVRTPGATLIKSATLTFDGVLAVNSASLGASVFDPAAQFTYRLPWEFQGGAAFVHDRVQFEMDVEGYTPIEAYTMVATGQPSVTYGDNGTNVPPSIVTRPFGGITSASNGVVNVSGGGHVVLLKGRSLRIHSGIATNQSPVNSADTVFTKADLISWTLGLSGSLGKFQFAAGLDRKSGTADDLTLRNLLSGQTVASSIDIRTLGFIYSLAYQF
jgi:hypothetical protein